MYEIEIKLPVGDAADMEKQLAGLGFLKLQSVREEDHYFDNEAAQIKNSGEALRVRTVTDLSDGRSESVITFKGKKMDTVSKSRKELETGVSERETAMEILRAIGFHAVEPAVVKIRKEYTKGRMHACLDSVEGLGDFLELEIVVESEADKDPAMEEIAGVLSRLGYSLADTERRSYLGLLTGAED